MRRSLLKCYHDPEGTAKRAYIKTADYIPFCHPAN